MSRMGLGWRGTKSLEEKRKAAERMEQIKFAVTAFIVLVGVMVWTGAGNP